MKTRNQIKYVGLEIEEIKVNQEDSKIMMGKVLNELAKLQEAVKTIQRPGNYARVSVKNGNRI